jgi:hypothetical protein
MRREWEPEELVASWTLVERDERELISYKHDGGRLAFSLTLKFFELEGRFPRHAGELPPAAVSYVARQVGGGPGRAVRLRLVGPLRRAAPQPDPAAVRVPPGSARTTR